MTKLNIKQCVSDQFQQNSNNGYTNFSKTIDSRIFKDIFGLEDFFDILDENTPLFL